MFLRLSAPEEKKKRFLQIKCVFLTLSVLGEDAGCDAADVFFADAVVAHLKTHKNMHNNKYQCIMNNSVKQKHPRHQIASCLIYK